MKLWRKCAAPRGSLVTRAWHLWLRAQHLGTLVQDRAWQNLELGNGYLVSCQTRSIHSHVTPGLCALALVPIRGHTEFRWEQQRVRIDGPTLVHTHTAHEWIAHTNPVYLARKFDTTHSWNTLADEDFPIWESLEEAIVRVESDTLRPRCCGHK